VTTLVGSWDRVIFPIAQTGVFAYDVRATDDGPEFTPVWGQSFAGLTVSTVLAGFQNVVWLGLTDIGTKEHFLTAIDIESGAELFRIDARDLANITLLRNGDLFTNNIGFTENIVSPSTNPLGVQRWRPVSR
jgi:hypothetical protein